jgi:hypothetical protein
MIEGISLSSLVFSGTGELNGPLCVGGDEMAKDTPDPLKPAHIPGQNPATPERMPGHTGYYEKEEKRDEAAAEAKKQKRETPPRTDPGR